MAEKAKNPQRVVVPNDDNEGIKRFPYRGLKANIKLRQFESRHPPNLQISKIRDSIFIITLPQIKGTRVSAVDRATRFLA